MVVDAQRDAIAGPSCLVAELIRFECRLADAGCLPYEDASVDVVSINGILNLNPARAAIFLNLGRLGRSPESVWAAELVLKAPQTREKTIDEASWFA